MYRPPIEPGTWRFFRRYPIKLDSLPPGDKFEQTWLCQGTGSNKRFHVWSNLSSSASDPSIALSAPVQADGTRFDRACCRTNYRCIAPRSSLVPGDFSVGTRSSLTACHQGTSSNKRGSARGQARTNGFMFGRTCPRRPVTPALRFRPSPRPRPTVPGSIGLAVARITDVAPSDRAWHLGIDRCRSGRTAIWRGQICDGLRSPRRSRRPLR
jgi:hypothetical protein